ncbi:MAG: aminotransferase class V-fold PLP-dependent enzyme [Candidatus Limnocylindria bacterium]
MIGIGIGPDEFSRPSGIYLLSHSVGLAPRTALGRLEEDYFDAWMHDPEQAWPRWLAEIEEFRAALARLLNHRAKCFCPQANVSSATTKILQALPRRTGSSTILLTEEAFPSIGFVVGRATDADNAVRFIGRDEDAQDPAVWATHMTPGVGLVVITHVHSNGGQRLPVNEIVALARERSIVSIVDIAQSVGVVPIDLAEWNADFVVGSSVKWLCGGPGAGFLWVNPEMLPRCEPMDVGWFSHADPFELDIHRFRFADDALRFWGGTPSVLPFVVARRSIELLDGIGIEAIRAHNVALSDRLVASVDDGWLVTDRDPSRRGGTVVLDPGDRTQHVVQELRDGGAQFDSRAAGIRLSPHIYNTADEVDAVAALLML